MNHIGVAEFKAMCLRLLNFRNGKPPAVVDPASAASRKAAFGALRSSLTGPVGDLVSPFDEREWKALRDHDAPR